MTIQQQQGATMIEILITLVVMSVGLLGLGATQIISLKNANQANHAYYATMAAYDISERMRANPFAVIDGQYNGGYNTSKQANGEPTTHCEAQPCSAVELAQRDRAEWELLLAGSLPQATGNIQVNNSQAAIEVTWQIQASSTTEGDPKIETKSFTLMVDL